MDKMHPYTFHRNPVTWKLDLGMQLLSLLLLFVYSGPTIPTYFFNCFIYLYLYTIKGESGPILEI